MLEEVEAVICAGKITIPAPFQLPSTVYDPSLIQPNYRINNRQPVNTFTDASTDWMTPFTQSMISNHIANQPNNYNPGGNWIKEKDVKPVNPIIQKPNEEIVKNPQTYQSHPNNPNDITMDSEISTPLCTNT